MLNTKSEIGGTIQTLVSQLAWIDAPVYLDQFVEEFHAPNVVRLVVGASANLDLGPAPLNKPFLAFSRRRRTKMYAENLCWEDKTKKFQPKGPPLEIPKDYIGWFEIARQGVAAGQGCHRSLASIAESDCKNFLLRTTVVGYRGAYENGNLNLETEARAYPGEVLTKGELIAKKWKVTSMGTSNDIGTDTNETPKGPETKFLQCFDKKKREIFLPIAHPGQFFGIWDPDSKDTSPRSDVVYYAQDLLNFSFPILVRMVFGWPPQNFPNFTGFLRLIGVNRPDTIVLRSLKLSGQVIVEIPIDADVKVHRANNMDEVNDSSCYKKVLDATCDFVYPYLISMKTVTIKYQKKLSEPESPKEKGKTSVKNAHGRMAMPNDMSGFSPLDVFPPMEDDSGRKQVSESWTLSFRDPAHVSKPGSDENAVWADIEEGQLQPILMRSGSRNRSEGTTEDNLDQDLESLKIQDDTEIQNSAIRKEMTLDRRAFQEKDIMNREATC